MKLTDRIKASGASLTDLIHIVITGDTSQDPAGSSYKISMGDYASLFGGSSTGSTSLDTYWVSGSTWDGTNYPIKANNDSGLDATGNYSVAEGYSTTAIGWGSHAEGGGFLGKDYEKGGVSLGDGSHAEGILTTAIGVANHAEGILTFSGIKAFSVPSIINGVITLESYYGDVTSAFTSNINVVITNYGLIGYVYNTVTFSSLTNTEIFLDDVSVNTNNVWVVDFGNYADSSADVILGNYSHAEGNNTVCIGESTHAEGSNNIAFGDASHVEGQNSISVGPASHAEGFTTTASGNFSHTEGFLTAAIGLSTHAEGSGTTAIGVASHSEGWSTTASGDGSHAEGRQSTASGDFGSHAEGFNTIASGESSHAEGEFSTATAFGAHAEGVQTTASEQGSHSEGAVTIASGIASHSEGNNTVASGDYSHSQNRLTVASGDYSHAGGYQSTASGDTSFVHGNNSIAVGNGTIVLGDNITGTTDNFLYTTHIIQKLTIYTNDAAAAADINLPSGGAYLITGNRTLFIKP